jgi:hypothetical protein
MKRRRARLLHDISNGRLIGPITAIGAHRCLRLASARKSPGGAHHQCLRYVADEAEGYASGYNRFFWPDYVPLTIRKDAESPARIVGMARRAP